MSNSIIDKEKEKILLLRGLTETTGILHELQINHLKYWWKAAFAKQAGDINIDTNGKVVIFKKINDKRPKSFQQTAKFLQESVKYLLGERWSIKIKHKNKVLF